MSATVAYALIGITVLAIFAVGAVGWWMSEKTLGEDEEDDQEPPTGGSAA